MKMRGNILTAGSKRTHSFWNNDMSLTSKRGGVLLSNRAVAKDLAKLVRELKNPNDNKMGSFEITNPVLIRQLKNK